ncbi:MAG: hypothetical protein K2J06_02615, partial [Muribaculaceae bacterium]|nr:hypothetical protein [Muribaculaceae bacterium]
AQGVIRRQGSVMVEVALDKVVDFAMLYDITDSGVVFRGLSLFYNEAHSTYAGNILGSPSFLNSLLCRYVDIDSVEATKLSVADTLTRLLYGRYRGPVGVDMLVYRAADGSLCIAPCVEVNLRMTMGRVAHELHTRHLSAEFTGLMQLRHGNSPADSDIYMRLNPPGHPFSMVVRALSDADIAY